MVKKFYDDRKIKLGGKFTCTHFCIDNYVNPVIAKILSAYTANSSTKQKLRNFADIPIVIKAVLQLEALNRPRAEDVTKHLFYVAQTAVCGDIFSAIERNSDQIDLGLQVEFQHLIIWRAVSGFDAARLEEPKPTWFATTHSYQEYDALQELLKSRF